MEARGKKRALPSDGEKKPKKAKSEATKAEKAPPAGRKLAKKKEKAKAAVPAPPPLPAAVATAAASSRLDVAQVGRSVRALLTHVAREGGKGLLDSDAPVHVLLATKHVPKAVGKAKACKPVPLTLPHPYVDLETAEICLITKDPHTEYKDRLAEAGLRATVLGVSSLKKKYHPHQAKRELCKAHEIFLADARVLPMLPPLLGKTFFTKRRLPIAVDLKKTDIRAELTRACGGATYRVTSGNSNSVQLGTTAQEEAELVANIVAGVEQVRAGVRTLPIK